MRLPKTTLGFIILFFFTSFMKDDFKGLQLKYDRVKTAYDEKSQAVFALLANSHITPNQLNLYFRAFKKERMLEIWGKNQQDTSFQLLITYPIAGYCGNLGPKRKEGDMQIPEGFYHINRFNPLSNFYLSLGLNYPNESDKILGFKPKLGSDIFIHGTTVTSGCLPITDDKIREVYILAIEARNAGQTNIPVDIFPTRLSNTDFEGLQQYAQSSEYIEYWRPWLNGKTLDVKAMIQFWAKLKPRYDYFEKNQALIPFAVNRQGAYYYP
jgi:murein L,D-transpeptidase YafK